jgi:hypothetical protein
MKFTKIFTTESLIYFFNYYLKKNWDNLIILTGFNLKSKRIGEIEKY